MRLHDTPPTWIPTEANAEQIPDDVKGLLGDAAPSRLFFEGRDLLTLPDDEMRAIRGNDIAMIFQEPMTSLNPVFTVGDQIAESTALHLKLGKKEAWEKAVESITLVGINNPERRAKQYPARAVGWDATADHDRDGPGVRPEAPDRR